MSRGVFKRRTHSESALQIFVCIVLALSTFIMIYPFVHVVMYSISDPKRAMGGGIFLVPKGFDVYHYQMLFQTEQIWVSLRVSILKTIIGTALSILISTMLAYPLSVQRLHGRNIVTAFIFFTMLFSGGMIPTYLIVKDLGLYDTFFALILPGAVSAYNVMMIKNYMQSIPASLEESARIDGANAITTMFRIILPITTPCIAAVTLLYALGNWNSYMDGLLYTNKTSLQLLQIYLRNRLTMTNSLNAVLAQGVGEVDKQAKFTSESTMQMVVVTVTIVPVLIVYPFLARYYTSGLMVGAVKG